MDLDRRPGRRAGNGFRRALGELHGGRHQLDGAGRARRQRLQRRGIRLRPRLATDALGNWVVVWYSDDDRGGTIGTDFDVLFSTGIGPDLFEGARTAVRGMIDLLTADHGMTAEQAYMLCSVCADLRISEIVDAPNWLVSLYFPRLVLE